MEDGSNGAAEAVPETVIADREKYERAERIYTAWRNEYINNLPVEAFHRVQTASVHLINAIAAALP